VGSCIVAYREKIQAGLTEFTCAVCSELVPASAFPCKGDVRPVPYGQQLRDFAAAVASADNGKYRRFVEATQAQRAVHPPATFEYSAPHGAVLNSSAVSEARPVLLDVGGLTTETGLFHYYKVAACGGVGKARGIDRPFHSAIPIDRGASEPADAATATSTNLFRHIYLVLR
jgi:hypothetical protein